MLQIMDTQKLSKFWPHYSNESKSDFTPIEYAAMNGHTDIVKILAPLSIPMKQNHFLQLLQSKELS